MKMCVALSVSGIFASTCSQPSPYPCTCSPMSFSLCQLFVLSTYCCFVSWSPVSVCPLDTPWIFMSEYLSTHLQLLFFVCIICHMYLPQCLPLWYLTFGSFNNFILKSTKNQQHQWACWYCTFKTPAGFQAFWCAVTAFCSFFNVKEKQKRKNSQNTVLIQIYIFWFKIALT